MPEDLPKERYSLSEPDFQKMGLWASVSFHAGAHVIYVQPYEKHRDTNVSGTLTCIRSAVEGRIKPLHHLSTAAVTGPVAHFTRQERIFEDSDLGEYQASLPYDIRLSKASGCRSS